jgi:exodeoxyribonuclease VII small subunit
MAESKKKELTFEQKMSKLDDIVEKLNSGTLPLEQTLKLYEEAQNLILELSTELKNAKEKVAKYIE